MARYLSSIMPKASDMLFRSFVIAVLLCPLFAPVSSAQFYHFGRNKIQYEDFDWQVLKTEHFDVHYYTEMEELAKHGAYFAEEIFDELEHKFNFTLNHRIPLIFYSSNLHFKQTNTTPGFIPDGVGGFFEFLKGRVVIPANGDLQRFRRVIRHEVVHVYTFVKTFRVLKDFRIPTTSVPPLWFTEGLAEYWSGEPDFQHEMIMRDAIYSNYLVPLESMHRISGSYQMYKQGEAICRFISETYGEEKLLRLIDNFWKHTDFRKVMELTLHEEFLSISDKWDAWLKVQYLPELERAQPAALISEPLSKRGFSSKPSYYQYENGKRSVFYVGNRIGYTNLYEQELDSLYKPIGKEIEIIKGERGEQFEAFHFFESRTSISKDGKLAFVTKSGASNSIHVYNLERKFVEASYKFENQIAIYSPTWSPDGTELAFTSIDRSGFIDLYRFDTESEVLLKLTNDAYDERDPSWSPDGRYLAFSSDRTSTGSNGSHNLFVFDLESSQINYVTFGEHFDFSPRWSPNGEFLLYTSARRDSSGRFGAQDIWMVDMTTQMGTLPAVASRDPIVDVIAEPNVERHEQRLTRVTSAAYDPIWTDDGQVIFSSFERSGFTIRNLGEIEALRAKPKEVHRANLASTGRHWKYPSIEIGPGAATQGKYKRKYTLDIAQGQISQNQVLGTYGGAIVSFSDLMSNDRWFLTMYNLGRTRSEFLRSMNVVLTRVHYNRRANFSYGLFRFGGERYDITDPDAPSAFPYVFETMYGASGAVSYPISMFQRIEFSTSLSYSDREIFVAEIDREAILLSNAISLVHDNTLNGFNGPVQGWRANFTTAYTTDILYSNVNYWSMVGDLRTYWRITPQITFATRMLGRINHGREARLFILGGSWDLRGQRLFDVRGKKMWFVSNELRFPILNYPSLFVPILAPFGVVNLRGALFFDAAHAWNDEYRQIIPDINAGETLGAAGLGLRMNLFGGLVLRYDIGYSYSNGFEDRSNRLFKQFFFGYDF